MFEEKSYQSKKKYNKLSLICGEHLRKIKKVLNKYLSTCL